MNRPTRLKSGNWRIRWIDENKIRRSAIYQDSKDASYQLSTNLAEVESIKRGLARARPVERTFKELCDLWLETKTVLKKNPKDDISIINKHLLPFFGAMKISQIGVEHGERYRALKKELTAKTQNNHLTLLISMLNYARELK